ncbi:MAG: DUF1847 domain-containing protein [Promethearchaeota archaeon]
MSNENKKLEKKDEISPTCHKCNGINFCVIEKPNKNMKNCPMIVNPEIEKEAINFYKSDEFIKKTTSIASIVEAEGYINWPRLKDTIEFAKRMGFLKLGLAFCIGLLKEARKTAEYLEKYGFKVYSVCCKTGSLKKTDIDVPEEYTMFSKTGYPIGLVTCNPVAQALLLNKANTEMNIIIGLCVGHDITFTNLSDAPVTTLIAKDRSCPHNAAAILYTHYGDAFFSADLRKLKK